MKFKNAGGICAIAFILIVAVGCQSNYHKTKGKSIGQPAEIAVITHENSVDELEPLISVLYENDSLAIDAENPDKKTYEHTFNFFFRDHKTFSDSVARYAPLMFVVNMGQGAGGYDEELRGLSEIAKIGTQIKVYENVWAKPQTVIAVTCKNAKELASVLAKYKKELNAEFVKSEIKNGLTGFMAPNKYSDSINKLIYGAYGFKLDIAPVFTLAQTNKELVYFVQETPAYQRHLFINIFSDSIKINSLETGIANRDYFTKKYVKNREKTDIVVSKSNMFPQTWNQNVKIGNNTFNVLRGWYTEEGLYRRGMFARYFYHDFANKRYVVLDGFIYAPNAPKEQMYRLFDLTAASLKFN